MDWENRIIIERALGSHLQMSFFAIEYLRLQTHLAMARSTASPGHLLFLLLVS